MKISAYHKSRGDHVKLYESNSDACDILYKSKAFSFSKDLENYPRFDKMVQGGSGYAIDIENGKEIYDKGRDPLLPQETESQHPCKDREILLRQLIVSGSNIDYTQGLDARFITDDIAKLICRTKIDMIHFAFDFMKNERQIIKGLEIFRKHFKKSDRSCRVYILTNYDTTHEEDYYRVKKVIELGYQPYVMIYRKGTHDRFLTDLARWANSSFIYRSCKFEDYAPRVDKKLCKELYRDVI